MSASDETPEIIPSRLKLSKVEKITAVCVTIYNIIIFIFSLLWIFTNSFSACKAALTEIPLLQINEKVTYVLFLAGALGGSFYCLRSIYVQLAEAAKNAKDYKKHFDIEIWFFWYLFRPLQSGALALITLCLFNSGLLKSQLVNADDVKSFYTLIGIGFLVGFGTREVSEKVEELIGVLFAKAKPKDK